jgi:EmrB/QacA subfamily drug resistance transporter
MSTLNASEQHKYPGRWWAFVALSFSLLVIGLDNTVLNVALPTIARDLSATQSQLQWIVDAYTLIFAGLLLTMGSLGDRFGRKKALLVGLTIFGAGSIWAAFSGSANVLIAARAFMGIGGALIMPTTLSITTNIFEGKERGRAIGAWAGVSGLSIIAGPVFGGWLLDHYAWGAIFLINMPIIAFVLLGVALLVPESKDPAASKLDPVGALLSIAGLTALLWGIIELPVNGWSDGRIIAAFVVAAILLLAFIAWELRAPSPMLNMKLFRNPRFSAASLALTLTAFGMFGALFILTQYLQFILGYTPLQAGSAMIALIPTLLIGSIISPRIVERIGTKIPVTIGLVIVACGFTLFSTASANSSYGLIALMLAIVGFGFGLTMAPATASIMGALPLGRAGVGSAVNDTTRQVGGAFGVAILGSILSSVYQSSLNSASIMHLLPPAVRELVRDSIGKAAFIASQLSGRPGQMLTNAVNTAFIDALHTTILISAGVTLCGALVALLFLPAYTKDEQKGKHNLTQDAEPTTMEEQEEKQLKA